MKYLLFAIFMLFLAGRGHAQPEPNFESTVKVIQQLINRCSTDSAEFAAKENGEFRIGDLYSSFFHLKASEDDLNDKDFITPLDQFIAVRKDGAHYHVVMFKPEETIFSTFGDKEYALKVYKALIYLKGKCTREDDFFDKIK